MTFLDLLFREYASPFLLLDNVIASGRLEDFINKFQEKSIEKQRWEFFIHKLSPFDDTSWDEFNERLDSLERVDANVTPEQLETTVTDSFSMLQGFVPEEKKGG